MSWSPRAAHTQLMDTTINFSVRCCGPQPRHGHSRSAGSGVPTLRELRTVTPPRSFSYRGLREAPPLPPATRFSPGSPDSAPRRLSPSAHGDKIPSVSAPIFRLRSAQTWSSARNSQVTAAPSSAARRGSVLGPDRASPSQPALLSVTAPRVDRPRNAGTHGCL